MKAVEYINKYKLETVVNFNKPEFIKDFNSDFITELTKRKNKTGYIPITGFENAAKCMRDKWEAINLRLENKLDEKLWKYFWKIYVADIRDELFPEEMAKRKELKEEIKRRKQEWEDLDNHNSHYFNGFNSRVDHSFFKLFSAFMGFSFDNFLKDFISTKYRAPREIYNQYFYILSLDIDTASIDDVKTAYRKLSNIYHPDKGAINYNDFIKITEAKNKCLEYFVIIGEGSK